MFMHNKKLQYTVRVAEPNPVLGTFLMTREIAHQKSMMFLDISLG